MAALAIAFAFAISPARANAQAAGAAPDSLRVEVSGLRNSNGQVGCAVYSSPDGFPDRAIALKKMFVPAKDQKALCDFAGLPAGDYSVSVYHDENTNGKFDKNFLGIPKEGWGFSENPPANRRPSFDETKFSYRGGSMSLAIKMNYY